MDNGTSYKRDQVVMYRRYDNRGTGSVLPIGGEQNLQNTFGHIHAPIYGMTGRKDTVSAWAMDNLCPTHINPLHLLLHVVPQRGSILFMRQP